MITVRSFSYRLGKPPIKGTDIDCRCMANPHNEPELRPLTGRDEAVQKFCVADRMYKHLMQLGWHRAERDGEVSFGCIGGRHRSAAMAEMLAEGLRTKGHRVRIEHWALDGLYPS